MTGKAQRKKSVYRRKPASRLAAQLALHVLLPLLAIVGRAQMAAGKVFGSGEEEPAAPAGRHQLELRFPGRGMEDFDELIALEERLRAALEPTHKVDGHDFGEGTMSIFIFSSSARAAFGRARLLVPSSMRRSMRASYRQQNGRVVDLWPRKR